MKSYSSTLLMILNSEDSFNLKYLNQPSKTRENLDKKWKIKYLLDGIPLTFKKVINFIPSFIFYKKTFNNQRGIILTELIRDLINITYNLIRRLFKKRPVFYKEKDEELK